MELPRICWQESKHFPTKRSKNELIVYMNMQYMRVEYLSTLFTRNSCMEGCWAQTQAVYERLLEMYHFYWYF